MTPDEFVISTDPDRLDHDWIHRSISTDTYWATGRTRERVERSIANSSLLYGMYASGGEQVGFARVLTDRTVFAYLSDVYIDRSVRGLGLGKRLVERVIGDVEELGVRRFVLATDDAQDLYSRYGFTDLADDPSNWMVRLWADRV